MKDMFGTEIFCMQSLISVESCYVVEVDTILNRVGVWYRPTEIVIKR